MRIIALMNQKGGVGKTTTTANLGAALAELGQRVCLIDLAGAEIELVSVIGRETLLKKKLEDAQHDFDVILLDCPPSLGLLTINALAVAHEVIIPMQPHFLALQGVAKLLETIQLVNKRMNPQLKVAGIVLTMYDAQTKLTSEVVNELHGFIQAAQGKPLAWAGAKVFNTKIRRNIKLAECPSFGQTILKYDGASNGAFDYRNLARELLGIPPLAAPVARPGGAIPAPVKTVAVQQVPTGATMPPKPVMPAALVAAMKAQAVKRPAAVAPQMRPAVPAVAMAAVPAKGQAPAAPVAKPAIETTTTPPPTPTARPAASAVPAMPSQPIARPLQPVSRPPQPPPAVQQPPQPQQSAAPTAPRPVAAVAPVPAPKPISVTVPPTIDHAKLAASNPPAPPATPTDPAEQQEVA